VGPGQPIGRWAAGIPLFLFVAVPDYPIYMTMLYRTVQFPPFPRHRHVDVNEMGARFCRGLRARHFHFMVAFAAILNFATLASAACECGYRLPGSNSSDPGLYTDLLESDFFNITDITKDTDYVVQTYSVDKSLEKDPYSRTAIASNVISNPVSSQNQLQGSNNDGDPGLQLYVRGKLDVNGSITGSELDTTRTDMWWGSYRALLKLPSQNGTCASFFWYYNDIQEIDMEFLSTEVNGDADTNSTESNLYFVLHTQESKDQGDDASKTPTFKHLALPFKTDDAFHEYRFDYSPGRVEFYVDSKRYVTFTGADVPDKPGHVVFNHWSNGDPHWSYGPPTEDAVYTIGYLKAYFNSSDTSKLFLASCRT
jgi:Glycosyl hydrolases family 16